MFDGILVYIFHEGLDVGFWNLEVGQLVYEVLINERGVPNFSYQLAEIFWRFLNEFAMIRTRYRL